MFAFCPQNLFLWEKLWSERPGPAVSPEHPSEPGGPDQELGPARRCFLPPWAPVDVPSLSEPVPCLPQNTSSRRLGPGALTLHCTPTVRCCPGEPVNGGLLMEGQG